MIQMFDMEFIGGPYDGHKEPLGSFPPAEELAWVVCDDVIPLLAENHSRERKNITSVAIYELELANGTFYYRFLGAISFKELADALHSACIQMASGGPP